MYENIENKKPISICNGSKFSVRASLIAVSIGADDIALDIPDPSP